MRTYNQVVLLGNAAADPTSATTTGGKQVVNFPLAVDREWPETTPEKTRTTDFHKIVAWEKLGDICMNHIVKGSRLLVTGKIMNHQYEVESGKKFVSEIHATTIEILNWKKDNTKAESSEVKAKVKTKEAVTA